MRSHVLALGLLALPIMAPSMAAQAQRRAAGSTPNWELHDLRLRGEGTECEIWSTLHYLDTRRDISYGATRVRIGVPSGRVTIEGINTLAYFRTADASFVQVNNKQTRRIHPPTPARDTLMVKEALAANTGTIKVAFKFGEEMSVHRFPLAGIRAAHAAALACSLGKSR
jgi:hypothetical protein